MKGKLPHSDLLKKDWDTCTTLTVGTISRVLIMLSCNNVEDVARPLSKTKIDYNKKAGKKGKIPYFEYHELVLHINPKTARVSKESLKHKSPRQHRRRGHKRTYQSGESIWIHSMIVGDAANGVISKDYKITL